MKQELIYQAILSTLAHEATDEEQQFVDEWLHESEENREDMRGCAGCMRSRQLPVSQNNLM